MLILRFDFGIRHGLGHLFRCLEIIRYLDQMKINYCICTEENKFSDSYDLGREKLVFYKKKEESEEDFIFMVVKSFNNPVLFLDTLYEYTESFVETIRKYSSVIFFHNYSKGSLHGKYCIYPIEHLSDNLILNYTNKYKENFYYGYDYTIINSATINAGSKKYYDKDYISVTFGGSDPLNILDYVKITLQTISNYMPILVHLGLSYIKDHPDIQRYAHQRINFIDFNYEYLYGSSGILCTLGTTVFECIYKKIPVMYISHNSTTDKRGKLLDNITPIHSGIYLGKYTDFKSTDVIDYMISEKKNRVEYLDARDKEIIDGKGAQRVANILRKEVELNKMSTSIYSGESK